MIVAGPDGFRKNQYRKFNMRASDLAPGDDYGMMRETLGRRFKRLMAERRNPLPCGRRWRGAHEPGEGSERRWSGNATLALAGAPLDDAFGRRGQAEMRGRIAVARSGADRRRAGQLTAARKRSGNWVWMCRLSPSPRDRIAMPGARRSSCPAASRSGSSRAIRSCISSNGCVTRPIASPSGRTARAAGATSAKPGCRKFPASVPAANARSCSISAP